MLTADLLEKQSGGCHDPGLIFRGDPAELGQQSGWDGG
jgi:hypothetical protein